MSVLLLLYVMVGSGVIAALSISRYRDCERVGVLDYVMGICWPAWLGVLLIFAIDALDSKLREKE